MYICWYKSHIERVPAPILIRTKTAKTYTPRPLIMTLTNDYNLIYKIFCSSRETRKCWFVRPCRDYVSCGGALQDDSHRDTFWWPWPFTFQTGRPESCIFSTADAADRRLFRTFRATFWTECRDRSTNSRNRSKHYSGKHSEAPTTTSA